MNIVNISVVKALIEFSFSAQELDNQTSWEYSVYSSGPLNKSVMYLSVNPQPKEERLDKLQH